MIHRSLPVIVLLVLFGPWAHWVLAQSVPAAIPYTGLILSDGIPVNGDGYFKFAIIDQNNMTLWSNDGSTTGASGAVVPTTAVTVFVSNGLYALELGNQNQPLTSAVFSTPVTSLRVWFSASATGPFELLAPDRQFISVPYAHQADAVSGTGTVVKSIAPSGGTPLTDNVVLDGVGNIDIQQTGNTITIVGTTGTAAALDLACANPCVSSAEISGPLADALIPDLGTLSGVLTDVQIPDLNMLSGTLSDTQIPNLQDLSGALTATQLPAISAISGTLTEMQIPANIARDNEVTTGVANAVGNHIATNNAHPLSTYTDGTLAEARIDPLIARDTEVPTLAGPGITAAITDHSTSATTAHSFGSITGTLPWARLAGIPADIADGDQVGIPIETDPQIGALSDTQVPRWSTASGTLVNSQIVDTGAAVGIGTTTAPTTLTVNGTVNVTGAVTVASLDAGYVQPSLGVSAVPGLNNPFVVSCQTGRVLGGGVDNSDLNVVVLGSWPSANNSWSVRVNNLGLTDAVITVYAICAAIQ